jgi:hypothetical protein
MRVVLEEILTLAGRLDDAPGFDAPRERYRRFLARATDIAVVRSLIEQGQRSLSEQHHRALQDAVVMLGRFLGFDTTFGAYQRGSGAGKCDGRWRSHRRLEIVLDIRTNQTPGGDVDELSRALSSRAAVGQHDGDVHQLGLCIVTPLYGSRARLEDSLRAAPPYPALQLASVQSLLWLADAAGAGRLSHDEVVRLLVSDSSLDFAVDLLARFAARRQEDADASAAPPSPDAPAGGRTEPLYWAAVIGADETATPEQFVTSVIQQRQVLGVAKGGPAQDARVGDWLCLAPGATGIVGHARVAAIEEDGAGLLRGAHRFRSILRLEDVEIYDAPLEFSRHVLAERIASTVSTGDAAMCLVPVSHEEFSAWTLSAIDDRPEDLQSR